MDNLQSSAESLVRAFRAVDAVRRERRAETAELFEGAHNVHALLMQRIDVERHVSDASEAEKQVITESSWNRERFVAQTSRLAEEHERTIRYLSAFSDIDEALLRVAQFPRAWHDVQRIASLVRDIRLLTAGPPPEPGPDLTELDEINASFKDRMTELGKLAADEMVNARKAMKLEFARQFLEPMNRHMMARKTQLDAYLAEEDRLFDQATAAAEELLHHLTDARTSE